MKEPSKLAIKMGRFTHKCIAWRKPSWTSANDKPANKECPGCPVYWEAYLDKGYLVIWEWKLVDPRKALTK